MDLVLLFYWCQQQESEESPEGVAVLCPLLTSGIALSKDVKCSSCLHKGAASAQAPCTGHTRSVSLGVTELLLRTTAVPGVAQKCPSPVAAPAASPGWPQALER